MSLVETHNALPPAEIQAFLPAPSDGLGTTVLYTAATIPPEAFEQAFDQVRENMEPMYHRSSMGWNATEKRKEMRHPAMRYLVLCGASGEGVVQEVRGFASFMVTEEEGEEVIYCYELQMKPAAQGRGYGEKLMMRLEGFGKNVGLRKAMLTVFAENTGAMRFYRRIGYEVDEISPVPRRLRSGEMREPTYYIFSKQI